MSISIVKLLNKNRKPQEPMVTNLRERQRLEVVDKLLEENYNKSLKLELVISHMSW